MKIAFTICSNNYFAQACVLANSLRETNSGYTLVLGLVDRMNGCLNYSSSSFDEIIPVEKLEIDKSHKIYEKYNIVELNTAVKASYFKHLGKKYGTTSLIIYFDPDIAIFDSLAPIENAASMAGIVLSPHVLKPVPLDGKIPQENMFLNYGLYNLGFLALNFMFDDVSTMLNWWEERTLSLGFIKPEDGLFVDQLWINFVPLFFNSVVVLRHPGINMGPWNLHERILSEKLGKYLINDQFPLIFYHFSSYDYRFPARLIVRNYDRFSFENRPDLIKIYTWYQRQLIKNNVVECKKLTPPWYVSKMEIKNNQVIPFKKWVRIFVPPVIWGALRRLVKPRLTY